MDLRAAENRTWASLAAPLTSMPSQRWSPNFEEHGRDAFTFETLEELDDDAAPCRFGIC